MQPKYISDFTGPQRVSGDQLNYQNCPMCGSTAWKLYVDPKTGKWMCFAGQHGSGGRVQVDVGTAVLVAPHTQVEYDWPEVSLPPWENLTRPALSYLNKRGIDTTMAKLLNMVEWQEKYRVLIPYCNEVGEVIYWTARKYSERLGYGPNYISAPGRKPLYVPADPVDTCVIVEGPFDAIAVLQAGFAGIALGGKTLAAHNRRPLLDLIHDKHTTILLDKDALWHAAELYKYLKTWKPDIQLKYTNKYKDPASMPTEVLKEIIR